MRIKLPPFGSWTAKNRCLPGQVGRYSRWLYSENGELRADRGYSRFRLVAVASSKPGASFTHYHTDGTEYVWYALDTALYPETGSDGPTAFKSSLTSVWQPSVVAFPKPAGVSVFLNGTNSEAQLLTVLSGALDARTFDFVQPDANWTVTPQTTGGSLADAVYQVRVCQIDKSTPTNVFSEPAVVKTATVSGGSGNGSVNVDIASWSPDNRATHWRIAWTAAGGSDTPSAFVYSADVIIGTTTYTIQDTTTAGSQAFVSRNGDYRTAVMPLSSVDIGVLHRGRLIIFDRDSAEMYWSERDAPNHWYSTNELNTGVEMPFNGPVRWAASAQGALYVGTTNGVYIVTGDFTRDTEGQNPTYAPQVSADLIPGTVGGVAHNSAVVVRASVYFMSTQGPAVVQGLRFALLDPENVWDEVRCLDWDNIQHASAAFDPDRRLVCFALPRSVNATRAMDGASVAGTPDLILRWDDKRASWQAPLQIDVTHITTRTNAAKGTRSDKTYLMAMGPGGYSYKLGYGWGGGGPDDISGTGYDGILATSSTTNTAVFTLAGVSADQFNGLTVTLQYPTTDTGYPGFPVQRTITDTAVSGSTVTITWQGALTVPSSTEWTVRIAGLMRAADWIGPPDDYAQLEPGSETQLQAVVVDFVDMAGQEAVA